jgi:hypothetical protein
MKIKYVGPRPVINQHGITFKDGKEDRFVYLSISLQILQAIDKEYDGQKTYSYDINSKRFSNEAIVNELKKYEYILEEQVMEEEKRYAQKLIDEKEHISNMVHLLEDDKFSWMRNLDLMQEYRIQRAINKIYYLHCINNIKDIIIREKIKEIDAPFFEKYWHVLQTIQGAIENCKHSTKTNLEIQVNNNGDMITKLFLIY